ncbi:MAG TPA: ATP-binding protein [Marmoricola sp.]|nr:ATP-binding protein [Marmoricola sp.]
MTEQPDVELRLPADNVYVSVLRMTTAGLAARLDFTLDDIEDLRMAVGEACALVLEGADPEGRLCVGFELDEGSMLVTVAADSTTPEAPDTDTFAWQVLSALATDLEAGNDEGRKSVSFRASTSVVSQS